MNYLTSTEIISMILDTANGVETKTKIMYKHMLNYNQLNDTFLYLIENKLIEYHDGTKIIRTTEKVKY